MIKHIFLILLLLLVLMLWQPAIAQPTSIPVCTTDIPDTDEDDFSGHGFNMGGISGVDIDKDGDGLIEICDLEGLYEMRYQLDGSGYANSKNSGKLTNGCPESGCIGYELTKGLDFTKSQSYRSSVNPEWTNGRTDRVGWQPIGSTTAPFNSVFEGNGHTITNLYINRPNEDYVGLFAAVSGSIRGLHLESVDIKGRYGVGGITSFASTSSLIINSSVAGSVEGSDAWIGGLVGENYGSIINTSATGIVKGYTDVGGLVGYSIGLIINSRASVDVEAKFRSGGLVGYNQNLGTSGGRITNSYASGSVQSSFSVGGLVGYNDRGVITDVYASGNVTGSSDVGGLVGYNDTAGSIRNGYALGVVSGGVNAGGLVGYNAINATITNSYWDSSTTRIMTSAGGLSKTTAELQAAPASDLYVGWSEDNWEFGSEGALQYPHLKYGNIVNTQGHTTCSTDPNISLPNCASTIPGQEQPGKQGQLALQTLTLSGGVLEPPFDPTITYYEIVDIPTGHTSVTVTVMANDDSATITIDGQSVSQAESLLTDIGATTPTGINIVLTAMDRTKRYTIVKPIQPLLSEPATAPCSVSNIDRDDDGLIEICDLEGLYAIRYQLGGSGYKASADATAITSGCPAAGCRGYELVRNLDFDEANSYRDSRNHNQAIWTVADYNNITDRGWRPIGNSARPFNAIFNGNGYTISNLAINRDDANYVGLFGNMTSAAEIVATELLEVDVYGGSLVGGLVAKNDGGTIEHSYVSGNVKGSDILVGGLVGSYRGHINNSYAIGMVAGNQSVGGLVGESYGSIINSYALNNVAGRTFVGGLIGANVGLLSNSYSDGMVEGIINVGGLMGLNVGNIDNSYANSVVSGASVVGGLVGENRGVVKNSYASGETTGTSFIGGLVGINSGSIADSYWDKEVSGIAMSAGSADANGLLTNELQVSDLFPGWSSTHWDFAAGRYPILKYIVGDDDANPACDADPSDNANTDLPLCGTALLYQIPVVLTGEISVMGRADEGGALVLTAPMASAGNGNYSYRWTYSADNSAHLSGSESLMLSGTNAITLNVTIPVNFIAADANAADVIFEVEVSDGTDMNMANSSSQVTINKIDNDVADIGFSRRGNTITASVGSDDDGGLSTTAYQWQRGPKDTSAWMNIEGENEMLYTIATDPAEQGNEFRVRVMYTDGQGYQYTLYSNATEYDLEAPCIAAIADTDNDGTVDNDGIGGTIDIDKDGDGLIEICDLEGLNEIRYQLEGSGYRKDADSTEEIKNGCPTTGCIGYELVQDLDFNDDNNYRSPRSRANNKATWTNTSPPNNKGWNPIGGRFLGLFDGNGYTISNLYINREGAQRVGLFSELGTNSTRGSHLVETIKNVGLLDVKITGGSHVGGLVGSNLTGRIINNYVMGDTVTGNESSVGGLVGDNNSRSFIISSFADVEVSGDASVGGLAGFNGGEISHSYANGDVTGSDIIGGLSGQLDGSIINSYATGKVESVGKDRVKDRVAGVGGLVGFSSGGTIKNTYASGTIMVPLGRVSGGLVGLNTGSITNSYVIGTGSSFGVAGLVFQNPSTQITASYWDNNNRSSTSVYGTSKTTSELKSPTAPGTISTDVYYGWSRDDWDFGDNNSYPALRYSNNADEDACNPDVTISPPLPPCTIPLYNQPIRTKGLGGVFFLSDHKATTPTMTPFFSPRIFSYTDVEIEIPGVNTNIQLRPYAINSTATISITKQGGTTTNYFEGKMSGELSEPIPFDRVRTLTIVVTDITDEGAEIDTTYTFDISGLTRNGIPFKPSAIPELTGLDVSPSAVLVPEFAADIFDYLLKVAVDANELSLTPTASTGSIVYRVNNDAEQAVMSGQPFTVTLTEEIQTITITVELPDGSSESYTISKIERAILTNIRLLLEGLLP